MENQQQQYQKQQQYQQQTQLQHQAATDTGGHCHNCGAALPPGALFCENCGAPQGGAEVCRSCGAAIAPGVEICPVCGHPATTRCTFCGTEMGVGEAFCPTCGNPRGGITCPTCGTLNFRSFCRCCNTPLNYMALYAVEQAKADPRYQRATAIAQELQQMEDEMEMLEKQVAMEQAGLAPTFIPQTTPVPAPEAVMDTTVQQSEMARRLMEEFAGLTGETPPPPQQQKAPEKKVEQKPVTLSLETPEQAPSGGDLPSGPSPHRGPGGAAARLAQLKEQYKQKLAEFQQEIDAMVPNPADPPEIQRNFACAHMITTLSTTTETTVRRERVAWICNKCQIRHNNPSECGVREFGGKWVTRDVIETRTVQTTSSGSINI